MENTNRVSPEQLKLVWRLSLPAIMAQLTSILMQYIDAAMVGRLGAEASASIGLVASSTWLLGGFCSSVSTGFSVQVAHCVGAKNLKKAREIFRLSIRWALLISFALGLMGVLVSFPLPVWLRGEEVLRRDASFYFLIYSCSVPALQMNNLAGAMLQCSGNMKVPGLLNSAMCILDIIFNAIFIFGCDLGVMGAALGTALSVLVIAGLMMYQACVRSDILRLTGSKKLPKTTAEEMSAAAYESHGMDLKEKKTVLKKALHMGLPLAFEHTAICGAMVATTRIVAPLGSISIAANSFAVTAESLCYMPGFGVGAAATTLVGQSFGAGDSKLSKQYAWLTTLFGMALMAAAGVLMYFLAPFVLGMLTPDRAVQELGCKVLRIELIAEPMYGASIVASAALRGAGDTLIPSILNLVSIWGVRLTLSVILVSAGFGLHGVWIAMCIELCVRGIFMLFRLARGKWLLPLRQ